MIAATYQAVCDRCGSESPSFAWKTNLYEYMNDPNSPDGKWYLRNGRHICHGCIIARACRIFGHAPLVNDYWCLRCKERIGPVFDTRHVCHFCGTPVQDDREYSGAPHSAKDCRPDLFEHEFGDTCTWGDRGCYWDHDNHELQRLGAIWRKAVPA